MSTKSPYLQQKLFRGMKSDGCGFLLLSISFILLFLAFYGQGCIVQSKDKKKIECHSTVIYQEKVREQMEPLRFDKVPAYSEDEATYFRYYGLEINNGEHIFGTFNLGEKVLAAHVFKPPVTKGTVILLHGYFDHTGVWKHVIKEMVARKYTVALYDQPGHGLSSGDRAAIDDFAEYVSVLEEFLRLAKVNLPGPHHLIAHSMGGAVALDYLLRVEQEYLDRVVLIAPLVHSSHWNLSRFGHSLGKHLTDSVERAYLKTSSDHEFLEFTENDPLREKRMPLKWFSALVEWNQRIIDYEPSTLPVMVIQGTEDTTVDWEYNMEFIKEKFLKAEIFIIEKGGHHLINEALPMRTEVIQIISNYIDGLEALD